MVLGDESRPWKSGKGETRTVSGVEWGEGATVTESVKVELQGAEAVSVGSMTRKEIVVEVLEVVLMNFGKEAGFKGKLVTAPVKK